MPVSAALGKMFGYYRLIEVIGQGGMGVVYRAVDTRLQRNVAIKVLPAAFSTDSERMRRFEQEARATAALSHPNILAIYDIGSEDGCPFIVSELLEGRTLRAAIMAGGLSLRNAIDYATQIARGLAAAHDKHIVHRDLKPENVFITNDGHVKILDFGIAKLTTPEEALVDGNAATETRFGNIVGTIGYMSPEQLRGKGIDRRSDIFSFGAVLYEMVSGVSAFPTETSADAISTILRGNPKPFAELGVSAPPALERLIDHCLEKNPDNRFQSARDMVFSLESLGTYSGSGTVSLLEPAKTRSAISRRSLWWSGVALIIAAAITLLAIKAFHKGSPSEYHQVTFRRGTVFAARFTPDGVNVVYDAAWNNDAPEIYSARVGSNESRSLGIAGSELLAVSSKGDLAILTKPVKVAEFVSLGTLAQVPLSGGAPRELVENVDQAEWSPDGSQLAIVRYLNGKHRLEFPVGKVLMETTGWLSDIRISPDGRQIAFLEHPEQWDNRGRVSVINLVGQKTQLTDEWSEEQGLAWTPDGSEIWFTATKTGEAYALYAVTSSKRLRVVDRVPINLILHDISSSGEVLLSTFKYTTPIVGTAPGQEREREYSWLDNTGLWDLSNDGRTFLFQYYGEGSGLNYASYIQKTDGSAAMRLGSGAGLAISPDAKWVITVMNSPKTTVLLPTGPGEPITLARPGMETRGDDRWMPDSQHVLFTASEGGKPDRTYVQDISSGKFIAVTPERLTGTLVSPDGRRLFVTNETGDPFLFPISGGRPLPVHGLGNDDKVVRWTSDSKSLFVYKNHQLPVRIERLDPLTGKREFVREVQVYDQAGMLDYPRVQLSVDAKSYVYQLRRHLSELFVIKGLLDQ